MAKPPKKVNTAKSMYDAHWKADSANVAKMGDMNLMYTNKGIKAERNLMEKYPDKSFNKGMTNKAVLDRIKKKEKNENSY
jgi:hypothetical protein